MTPQPTFEALDRELTRAALLMAKQAVAKFGGDIYGFALYTSDEYIYVTGTLFTEPGLRQATENYFDKHDFFRDEHETLEEGMEALRWSPCDSPTHEYGEDHLEKVDELLTDLREAFPFDDDAANEKYSRTVLCCLLRAMAAVRQADILPAAAVLCVMMGDQSSEERLAFAEKLNPPAVVAAFRQQLGEPDLSTQLVRTFRIEVPDLTRLP